MEKIYITSYYDEFDYYDDDDDDDNYEDEEYDD